MRRYLHAQRALGGEGYAVVGGFSIDQESRAARVLVGHGSAQRVALLTYDEEHAGRASVGAEPFARSNLRRNDSLGVAGAAPVNIVCVFAARQEGRDRVKVSREDQRGLIHMRGFCE
jgi:hypothetical protein